VRPRWARAARAQEQQTASALPIMPHACPCPARVYHGAPACLAASPALTPPSSSTTKTRTRCDVMFVRFCCCLVARVAGEPECVCVWGGGGTMRPPPLPPSTPLHQLSPNNKTPAAIVVCLHPVLCCACACACACAADRPRASQPDELRGAACVCAGARQTHSLVLVSSW
jgi:hypothetical protein